MNAANFILMGLTLSLLVIKPVPQFNAWSSLLIIPVFLGFIGYNRASYYDFFTTRSNARLRGNGLLMAYALFIVTFCISFAISAFYDINQAFRSFFPYVIFSSFIPVIVANTPNNPKHLVGVLIFAGLVQAFIHWYLIVQVLMSCVNQYCIQYLRITLLNPRTTEPFILAACLLPLIYLYRAKSKKVFWGAWCVLLMSIQAVLFTQTRAMILSVLLGLLFILSVSKVFQIKWNQGGWIKSRNEIAMLLVSLVFFVWGNAKVGMEDILFKRFTQSCQKISISGNMSLEQVYQNPGLVNLEDCGGKTKLDKAVAYSNGRVLEEWLPALVRWHHDNVFHKILGIGGGRVFYTKSGQARRYIHNFPVYILLYNGILGVLAMFLLFSLLLWTMLRKARKYRSIEMLACSGLLISMSFYSLFFAVHKLLSFNFMLMLLVWRAYTYKNKIKEVHSAVNCTEESSINSSIIPLKEA